MDVQDKEIALDPTLLRLRHKDTHHVALAMAHYWHLTYKELPPRRFLARRAALREAQRWGELAIVLSVEENAHASDSP